MIFQQQKKEQMENMKKIAAVLLGALLMAGASAYAAERPLEDFASKNIDRFEKGCQAELETYCKTVTPGRGRGVACIYAHNDKLSSQCENALYASVVEFRNAAENLGAFVAACQADVDKLCSTVPVGEGRVLDCLEKNKKAVSARCNKARQHSGDDLGKKLAAGA
jgi:hypothetical protein